VNSVYDFLTAVYQFIVSLNLHYIILGCAIIMAVSFFLRRSSH